MLQNFRSSYDHLVEARCYRVNISKKIRKYCKVAWKSLKILSCKLYNNIYMFALTQVTNTEISA